MGVDGLLDRLAQIHPEVKPVSDLHRVRGALPGSFAIAAGPIPADDLDLGMLPQPGCETVAIAVVEHLDRAVGGHVDEHGAVVAASPEREVVDAQHCHGPRRRVRQGFDQS